jgi:uncharacterized protein (DUF58 family)
LKFHFNPAVRLPKTKVVRHRFHFSFGITREGILFLILVALLSLAAINTGNNLLIFILAVLLSTIAVSGAISRNSLKQVSFSLQMPENVFVGDSVSIKVSMKNLKQIFPSFSIRVEDAQLLREHPSLSFYRRLLSRMHWKKSDEERADLAVFHQAAYFPILRPGETRSELIVQSFPRRGLYRLHGFWISTLFPFGFFRRSEYIGVKGEVLVYPSVQEISSFFHLLPFLPGWMESLHVGLGDDLFSMRPYQEGESARIIDWKATAKTGELIAREYAREEENKLCLILDTHVHTPAAGYEERFEKAVSLAAGISAHFLKGGAVMEFLTPQEYMPRGTGIDHLYRILRSLAVVTCDPGSPTSSAALWDHRNFSGATDDRILQRILSDKVFKIIITSKARRSFPSAIWRSSHVVFFEEL